MADYDLAAMAKAAGVNITKVLAAIEATQSIEDELYAIIVPIVRAYLDSIGYVEDRWTEAQLSRTVVEGLLATVAGYGTRAVLIAEPKVEPWAERVERWHRQRWTGVVKSAVRLDITPILAAGDVQKHVEAATARNVALIRNLNASTYAKIERLVWTAYADGSTGGQLAKILRDEVGLERKRARLIARDQLGKYSGALDQARHEQAGIDQYEWKTVGDGVPPTRATHQALNGKRFKWSKPPSIGHPGQPIQCRCKAKAVLFTAEEEAELAAAAAS
jgi:SPP1 gp7 family putative phage head morphogenesis protein